MRLVFENIDLTVVGHMQTIFEEAGIQTELRYSGAAGLAGVMPHTQIYPELWVRNNHDENRARSIIHQHQEKEATSPESPEWKCAKCGENVAGVFTQCWSCGSLSM